MKVKLPETITLDEFQTIMRATKLPHYKLAFAIGYFCALRISEVINLQLADIDFDRRFIFVRQGKGGKDRYVPFPGKMSRMLKKIPIPVVNRTIQYAINNISEKAIGRKIHFHTLRHSSATLYLKKGMNIREVQQLLGHSRLDTTMIYTHVNPEEIQNKMDDVWG